MAMTKREHIARHKQLHAALDEIFADYILHHKDEHGFTEMPVIQLLKWSAGQMEDPTPTESE